MKKYLLGIIALLFAVTFSTAQVDEVSTTTFDVDADGVEMKFPYYFTKPLDQLDESITRLVISQHGYSRNAVDYRLSMLTAAAESGASERTLILAPQFLIEGDIDHFNLANDYLFWSNSGWKIGDKSRDTDNNPRNKRISSFAVMDQLIMHVLSSGNFPNIKDIVIAGFSAGGQVVNRYAASNLIHEDVKQTYEIDIRYLLGGPSSFLYLDTERKVAGTTDQFAVPATGCLEYNNYKYGLNNRNSYLNQTTDAKIREQYGEREILYIVGDEDNNPNASALDKECPALLQGEQRLERSIIFFNYVKHYYGDEIEDLQSLAIIPGVGHNHNAIFRSTIGRTWIFKNDVTTSIDNEDIHRKQAKLEVYPNPIISSSAQLNYYVPEAGPVTLKVTDLSGKVVQEFTKSYKVAGNYLEVWNANELPNGLYIVNLQTMNQTKTAQLLLQQ